MAKRKSLEESSIIIAGLARNCEETIKQCLDKLSLAFNSAKNIKFIVVESDSTDYTITAARNTGPDIRVEALGRLAEKYPERTDRISICRNHYMKILDKESEYEKSDFLVVADLDGVNSEISKESVESCWGMTEDWDACFANQRAPYYDIWALRHDPWCPTDCWLQFNFLCEKGVSANLSIISAVYSRMIKIDPEERPIRVKSAFGGIAIYKFEEVRNIRYHGRSKSGLPMCEHVNFNSKIKNGHGNLFINPAFINGGWNEHNKALKSSAD